MRKPLRLLMLLLLGLLLLPSDAAARKPPAAAGPIPVTRADASWGNPAAPATLVVFTDLQCPYCGRLHPTVEALKKQYGPRKLRVVYKHHPLPFHKRARPAAEAAVAVQSELGSRAFWRFINKGFDTLPGSKGGDYVDVLNALGFDRKAVERRMRSGKPAKRVDADMALAAELGARGTPASFVNGVMISGAQPKGNFVKVIDEQIAAAKALRRRGIPAKRVYATLTAKNFAKPAPRRPKPSSRPATADDTTVWKVPVGRSPSLGPRSAPVTIVTFSDFQCPFCSRVLPTLEALRKRYGKQLRIVFKHQPLPFHNRAEPAAQLAMYAYATRGNKGFWAAHDKLFENQKALTDSDLEQYARELGLNVAMAMRAVRSHKFKKQIGADQTLAGDVEARGTPHFFVNGRRLSGAQPESAFAEVIDQELVKAGALRAKGIPTTRIYAHMMKAAKTPPPPETKNVPAPTKNNPTRGARHARVTIQMFTDFQCPFCSRVKPTLERIEKEYKGRVRIVYRHMPLAFHTDAMPAHQVAAEAFRQGGNKSFWKIYDLLFENQRKLDRASLLSYGRQAGLDVTKLESALDSGVHKKRIEADKAIASKVGISGTPAFTINGYYLSGAQPFAKFKRLIDRALAGK